MNGLNKKFDQLNINNNQLNNQIINYNNGERYVGQIINGLREGKGTYYFNNGDRYEGDWRNGKMEGKGIMYWISGNRDMGDYRNNQPIGKHARLSKSGEVKTNYY